MNKQRYTMVQDVVLLEALKLDAEKQRRTLNQHMTFILESYLNRKAALETNTK